MYVQLGRMDALVEEYVRIRPGGVHKGWFEFVPPAPAAAVQQQQQRRRRRQQQRMWQRAEMTTTTTDVGRDEEVNLAGLPVVASVKGKATPT